MVKIGQPLALLALYLANPKEILRHINTRGPKHVLEEDGYLKRCHPICPLLIEILSRLGGWLMVGYWVGGHLTHKNLGKS